MALQSILSPNRRESLPTPSAGVRMTSPRKRLARELVDHEVQHGSEPLSLRVVHRRALDLAR